MQCHWPLKFAYYAASSAPSHWLKCALVHTVCLCPTLLIQRSVSLWLALMHSTAPLLRASTTPRLSEWTSAGPINSDKATNDAKIPALFMVRFHSKLTGMFPPTPWHGSRPPSAPPPTARGMLPSDLPLKDPSIAFHLKKGADSIQIHGVIRQPVAVIVQCLLPHQLPCRTSKRQERSSTSLPPPQVGATSGFWFVTSDFIFKIQSHLVPTFTLVQRMFSVPGPSLI